MPFLPHLALLVSHQQCEVLLLLLLSKKLYMKRARVVGKLGSSLKQGAFPHVIASSFRFECFN